MKNFSATYKLRRNILIGETLKLCESFSKRKALIQVFITQYLITNMQKNMF